MRTLRSVDELRMALDGARGGEAKIGLVPTMGALHDGHLSLIRRAREECQVVVVTLFVNPTQFNDHSDLERYPRDEQRDGQLAARAGADILFAPTVQEMYPQGFATEVSVRGLTDRLEGAVRGAAHFNGVTTVVTKLLCMARSDIAYFGQKDAQQVAVIRRLVCDLNLEVEIVACPTVREADGLALSSRNVALSPRERRRAVALHRALTAAGALCQAGERSPGPLIQAAQGELARLGVEPEYVELVDPQTLEPLHSLEHSGLLAIAARVGQTRLIDNLILGAVAPIGSREEQRPTGEAALTCSV